MYAQVVRRKALTLPLVALLLASGLILARSGVSKAAVGDINTVAGNGTAGASGDGAAATAAAITANAVVSDNFGNYFIGGNGVVRRVNGGTGVISTVASGLGKVVELDMDGQGNLYTFETPLGFVGSGPPPVTVRKIAALDSAVSVLAANLSTAPPLGQDPIGPHTMGVAPDGTIYIGWPNQIIRYNNTLTDAGTVVAGNGLPTQNNFNSLSFPATEQRIGTVGGIAINPADPTTVYFSDSRGAVLKLSGSSLSIYAGGASGTTTYPDDFTTAFPATAVSLSGPTDIAFDASGAMYVINFSAVSRVSAAGTTVQRIIGDTNRGPNSYAGDGLPAYDAELFINGTSDTELDKGDVTVRPNGDVLVADGGNSRVRATTGAAALGGNGKGLGPGGDRTPITVDFTVTPAAPVAGEAVTFSAVSPGSTSWQWNFGDGTAVNTAQNPAHIFANPGTVSVTLTATNGTNGQSASVTKQINVSANPGGGCSSTKYCPITPLRVLETRPLEGLRGVVTPGPVGPGQTIDVDVVSPLGKAPSDVEAVVINVTGIATNGATFITVFPAGTTRPTASNINLVGGQVKPNLVIAKVGAEGRISLYNHGGNTHMVGDVMGWLPAASDYNPLEPSRVLDTRPEFGGSGPLAADGTITFDLKGKGGLPSSGLGSVVMNVTATAPSVGGFLTIFPGDGAAPPTASNLNFDAGETTANLVIAKVDGNGQIKIFNKFGTTHVIIDVLGFVPDGSALHTGLIPTRVLETRPGLGPIGVPAAGKVGTGAEVTLTVTGVGGVPASGVGAVVLNVTATDISAPGGFVTVYPNGSARPLASNLNLAPGDTVPNLVIVKVGADGAVKLFNSNGATHLIADVVGFMPA